MDERKGLTHRQMGRLLLTVELIGFGLVILFLWLDELLDFPRLFMKSPATPVNLGESLLESLYVVLLGALVVLVTRHLVSKIRHLEGFYRVCASCHRIWTGSEWRQFEAWVREKTEADFSHGLCRDCGDKLEKELDAMI